MSEREKSRLFSIAVLCTVAFVFFGFVHLVLITPERNGVDALNALVKQLEERSGETNSRALELRKKKETLKNDVLSVKSYFTKNVTHKSLESIQASLSAASAVISEGDFGFECDVKKIYFTESLDVKASFQNISLKSFFDYIAKARSEFLISPANITIGELKRGPVNIGFDFSIAFGSFNLKKFVESE